MTNKYDGLWFVFISSEFHFCFFYSSWESVSQEDMLVDTAAMTLVDLVMMEDMWINLMGMGMGPMITMVPMIAMDMDTAAMVEAEVAVTVAVIR